MGIPYILTDKVHLLTPIHGALAPAGDHAFVLSLAQMSVHPDSLFPGHGHGLGKGVPAAVNGLAGRHYDLLHGKRPGIVIQSDQPVAVL